MRLLQIHDNGELSLVEYFGDDIPPYAILSHTWGSDRDEFTFKDLMKDVGRDKKGYRKVSFCREQAAKDGLQYFWIDTCCIDKSSSAELSEAINSMFRWYQKSKKCYVYLADVSRCIAAKDDEPSQRWKPAFRKSRWFTRGWTLQELIAPTSVEFFSVEETYLGDKQSLEQTIHEITGIAIEALRGGPLDQFDKEERLLWAAGRTTKREEDAAYCMLGIFDVQMPLLYGEGREKASRRLHKEIRESSDDTKLSLNQEQRRNLIDSLRFDQIDARQNNIKAAHAKTCKWLLRKSEYADWLDAAKLSEHHGFLWIKGKPGTGKSTLMKFAHANARKTMKDKIVISFFFNARGEDIEKSTIGAYRSLLLQLLELRPALWGIFDSLSLAAQNIGTGYQWSVESLKTLLEEVILMLGQSPVVCFIDALDECEEQQIRDMISFFELVGERAVSTNIHFQVCFSSRHYPHITIQKGLNLVLEGQEEHSQDISNYLASELRIGKTNIAQQIRSELQEKASGIFMWVVLVVGILNKEHDSGQMHALRRRLREIPSDLHELFRDILTRDSRNKDSLALCIQFVLFAKQPLSPEQLYFAVLSEIEPDAATEWDPDEITKDVIKRFILDSSKGLAEITTSKLQKVQFIHESVRDFLLKGNGLSEFWPELGSNLQGHSHERLKRCCLTYMSMNVFTPLKIPKSLPKASSQEAADLRKSATNAFPFLEYAVQNVLHHADVAEGCGIAQQAFIRNFPLTRWVKLDNMFEKHEVRRHKESVSLLYILAERNMANLIGIDSSVFSCLEVESERYGPPLFAAMATRSKEAFQVFIEALTRDQLTGSRFREIYPQYSEDYSSQRNFGREFKFLKQRNVISYLAELGNEALSALVLSTGKIDINAKDKDNKKWTPLMWAVHHGHEATVRLLVDNGADTNAQDKYYGNMLYAAIDMGYTQIVKQLLEAGANVNAQGGFYGNALQVASFKGNKQIVKLLLDAGANVNAQGGLYGNALYAAIAGGHEQIVKLLLDSGVIINSQNKVHSNALEAAIVRGNKQIAKMLLEAGANTNAQGEVYSNALQVALALGNKQIVQLLLDAGANINTKGGQHADAL